MPVVWEQLDARMRPKILEASKNIIKEWVTMSVEQGQVEDSRVIVSYIMKTFAPGGQTKKFIFSQPY